MAKDLRYTLLFDIYAPLLTEKQRDTLELYYNDDLSLGEISEETGITRQGVMNCVKTSEQRLSELEERLGLAERFSQMKELTEQLETQVSALPDDDKRTALMSIIDEIKNKL